MFYRKVYLNQIKKDIENEKLILLLGARQVGKTTLLNILEDDLNGKKLYINLEDFFGKSFDTKDEFINFLEFEKGFNLYESGYLFLDEIQYLKNPESLLKSLYDDKKIKVKIIATGSRFWGQKKVGSSLVGRGKIFFIKTFSFLEFLEYKGKKVDNIENISFAFIKQYLEEYLVFGGYPSVVIANTKDDKVRELKKIIDRFLEKDFMYFMQSNDLIDFKKVFQYLALNIGNVIKIGKITSVLNISAYKIRTFLQFLLDSYLIKDIPPYFSDKSREYNSAEEFLFLDLGLLNYIRGSFDINLSDGKINENFVYIQLLDINKENNIYFYNKKNGSEIDFILENLSQKIIPIEVKSGNKTIKPKVFNSFLELYSSIIDSFIVTTNSISSSDTLDNKKINFIPNYLIESKIKLRRK